MFVHMTCFQLLLNITAPVVKEGVPHSIKGDLLTLAI